ncbi:MAG: hypothetical protein WB992_17740 [Bryobacteraceae bacterium]
MWPQIAAIAWAQFRTMRNHLPRTNVGTVLLWLVSLFWYGMYAALAVVIAVMIPDVPRADLAQWLPVVFLAIFLFWQVIPLFTLSSGWSLQLNKLQIYPVGNSALFGIEVLLRLSTAPEMILVLAGVFIGLERRPDTPALGGLFVLLYIPLNLFLSLAIRELLLHSFERNRFRELFAILLISLAVLPRLLLRTGLRRRFQPFFLAASHGAATPWNEIANLSSSRFSFLDLALLVFWTAVCYFLARWRFEKSLVQEETFRLDTAVLSVAPAKAVKLRPFQSLLDLPARLFRDPLAALLQKEFQSLLRMPRFRVFFGMACIFSVVIFLPMSLRNQANGFMSENFLPIVTLYGLLLLSDILLLNVFGLDRQAAQVYFVTPIPLKTVLRAKNLAAITFILLQIVAVLIVAALMRQPISLLNLAGAIACSAVVTIFFLSVGNLMSVIMPRRIDPTQTFKKQAGGKMQLWFAICSLGMFALVGFAFLARWALDSSWAFFGVLALEFAIGLVVYRVAMDSAVERGMRDREQILEALSRGPAPVGLGM